MVNYSDNNLHTLLLKKFRNIISNGTVLGIILFVELEAELKSS